MPRRLSRLALQVISVRLEPLHAITEDDVLLEGIAGTEQLPPGECSRVNAFAALWECLNGPGSWLRNPDVFRIEFAVKR